MQLEGRALKRTLTAWFIALTFVTLVMSLSAQQSQQQTLTGVVSDSACGATHGMKNMTAADCTRMCVKAGQKYALVVGKDVYVLQGHQADLEKAAGDTVTVKGTINGKTVTVESVAPASKGR